MTISDIIQAMKRNWEIGKKCARGGDITNKRAMIPTGNIELSTSLADAGQAANEAAALSVFADYRCQKAENTIRRQGVILASFSDYLAQVAGEVPTSEALASDPEAWRGVTWGLVDGFVKWLLLNG
jgi:hypothetical protein